MRENVTYRTKLQFDRQYEKEFEESRVALERLRQERDVLLANRRLILKGVESRLLKVIRTWDRFPADKESLLKIEADLQKDLGFDSLDQAEIMMEIEDEFRFEIPIEDSEKWKNGRDVFKYICEREDVYE
ncbi:unnamed protein product [Angiostrongylus costaricensis]|uniref:Acyl carrier protein n=1 Tax=Angiostrongylus costaricensis TaxID=334426 RepID=A0A0R3PJ50_ANGCS|nr:unnamed protein product [Angiostrongylus costaricensis]